MSYHKPFVNVSLVQARESVLAYFRPVLNEFDITEQQWRIIHLLAEQGTVDFQDLSLQTCILRPSLTGVLTRLENMDLVMRLKPASDQRRVFVKLTAQGNALFQNINAHMQQCYQKLETDFGSKKLQTLNQLLQELAQLNKPETQES